MDKKKWALSATALAISVAAVSLSVPVLVLAQAGAPKASAAPKAEKAFAPSKTPWGDPDLQGIYSNADESGIPFEKPAEFAGRKAEDISPEEFAKVVEQRQEDTLERAPLTNGGALRVNVHWFEYYNAKNSRLWLVTDPPDGKVPPLTAEAQQRASARNAARRPGPALSPEEMGLYVRCISRGVPGSMMPSIYGMAYQIVQTRKAVSISYEMVHEARIIPLDGSPHVGSDIRSYMGDPRGHWEGNTLVVETTNFNDESSYRGSDRNLRLVERFTPIGPNMLKWSVTFNDPSTWTKPWTFTMNLTQKDDSQQPFEYACHEGNVPSMTGLIKGAQADVAAAKARK